MQEHVVDMRGLQCPMPVLKTDKVLEGMRPGEVLRVITTDPATKRDIPALVRRLGDELLGIEEEDDMITFIIRKK